MNTIAEARIRAFSAINGVEKRSRITQSLGPEYHVALPTAAVNEWITAARTLLAHDSAAQIVERSMQRRWAFTWWVIGIVTALAVGWLH